MIFKKSSEHLPVSEIGGKAFNLQKLKEHGFHVPEYVVIPANVSEKFLSSTKENSLNEFEGFSFPEGFLQDIVSHFPNTNYFAVRSSAIDEDSSAHSYAGQFESFLYVKKEELPTAIKNVWKSAFSERVLAYREQHQLSQQNKIAVIIQEMVKAETSGVAFGLNPSTGNRREKVVSAVYGLGEGLVSGELNADTFIIENEKIKSSEITVKDRMAEMGEASGTKLSPVNPGLQNIPALNNEQVLQIAAILDELKKIYLKPQDIEFAFAEGKFFLLQSRPVTGLDRLPDTGSNFIIWDNSNIIESYPGLTLPLTFSFIHKIYEAVYKQFSAMMGVSENDIEKHKDVFANMLGLLNGRVYYNLYSWYKVLSLMPGYSINAGFMEKMMGVKEKFELDVKDKSSALLSWIRIVWMLKKMVYNMGTLSRQRKSFISNFHGVLKEINSYDFSKKDSWELMALYLKLENTLLKKWRAPLVNDFFAMIFFGLLQKQVQALEIEGAENLHNDLLCGSRDIISAEPARRTTAISTTVLGNEKYLSLFSENNEHQIWEKLSQPEFSELKIMIDEYISDFGDRTAGELKLETKTFTQRPENFIKAIKGHVANTQRASLLNETKNENGSGFELKLRELAEQKVNAALKGKPLKKKIFSFILSNARSTVSNRENLRYERTKAFSIVRRIFTAIGNNFYADGILLHPDDIYYLKKDEIFDFIKGTSVDTHFSKLVEFRKQEYEEYAKKSTSARIRTYGTVYAGNDFSFQPPTEMLNGDLKGIGCCPGRVTGKVRVIHDPNETPSLEGDILVTSSTDPGWIMLFPTASAILVERGSLLSHSAIVSREMGIPCIVSINNLLSTLKTGDLVEMDGSSGIIKILENSKEESTF